MIKVIINSNPIIDESRSIPYKSHEEQLREDIKYLKSLIQWPPKYYIHFTDYPQKLSTNLNQKDFFSSTPQGIYAYPLQSLILDEIIKEKEENINIAQDKRFWVVFEPKNPDKILHTSYRMPHEKYLSYIQKMESEGMLANPDLGIKRRKHDFDKHVEKIYYELLRSATDEKSKHLNTLKFTINALKLGIEGFVDDKKGKMIHVKQPAQAVFFLANTLNYLKSSRNLFYFKSHGLKARSDRTLIRQSEQPLIYKRLNIIKEYKTYLEQVLNKRGDNDYSIVSISSDINKPIFTLKKQSQELCDMFREDNKTNIDLYVVNQYARQLRNSDFYIYINHVDMETNSIFYDVLIKLNNTFSDSNISDNGEEVHYALKNSIGDIEIGIIIKFLE